MSGRIFQNVVLQLKENTDRTIGVIDGEGIVIACSELPMIGQRWAEYVPMVNGAAGGMLASDGKVFKALNGWGNQFDYAAFTFGDNEVSRTACAMATVALNAAKAYYEEKHDRGSFVKDIISDNIMLGDIYMRAKELRVAADVSRGVFVVRSLRKGESVPTDVVQTMFPDRQNDFVLSIGEGDVVLIHQMAEGVGAKELNKIAASLEEALRSDGESTVVVGVGTVATTCGTWPSPIRRPRSPLRWARSSTRRSTSSTTRTWASVGSSISCLPPFARCSSRRSSRRIPSTPWKRRPSSPSTSSLKTI